MLSVSACACFRHLGSLDWHSWPLDATKSRLNTPTLGDRRNLQSQCSKLTVFVPVGCTTFVAVEAVMPGESGVNLVALQVALQAPGLPRTRQRPWWHSFSLDFEMTCFTQCNLFPSVS